MYDDAALQPPDAPPSGRKPTQFECVTVLSDVQVRPPRPQPSTTQKAPPPNSLRLSSLTEQWVSGAHFL